MLIIALVLAVIGLAALVTAVVTSNELIAWVCIAASVLGVLLLIIDAIRERQSRDAVVQADDEAPAAAVAVGSGSAEDTYQTFDADYPDEDAGGDAPVVSAPDAAEPTAPAEVADPENAVDDELPEVHHVTSDEADTAMEVHHESAADSHAEIVGESVDTTEEGEPVPKDS